MWLSEIYQTLSWTNIGILVLGYVLLLALYRVTLHPLASFPGPILARVTFWYEFYHDFVRDGQYVFVIADLHKRYGPVVRIGPDELHVNDPAFLPDLMPAGGRRRHKYERVLRLFGASRGVGTTLDHDAHRLRRGAMSRKFSKESVRKLEPLMKENVMRLLTRLEGFRGTGNPINLMNMFGAFTNDLISQYAFGYNSNWLDAPHFNDRFFHVVHAVHDLKPLATQFPYLLTIMKHLPQSVLLRFMPDLGIHNKFQEELANAIRLVSEKHSPEDDETVFDEILESKLPEADKRPSRLLEEAVNISLGGTGTTSWTLSVLTFHLLDNPRVLDKLRTELSRAMPTPRELASLQELEKLPYLNAVVSEGLRMAMGTTGRQARINPDGPLIYRRGAHVWEIPTGTPVSITTPVIHLDADIFHEPWTFNPQRFLDNPDLRRSLVSFSHGSRQCVGMQLANAELLYVVAGIWRHFGVTDSRGPSGASGALQPYHTTRRDVDMAADRFIPYPVRESTGVHIVVI